jgi:hypothetical protein
LTFSPGFLHRNRQGHLLTWLALEAGMLLLLLGGTWLIDAAFEWRMTQQDPRYGSLPGTCYWAGDVRNYMRIAVDGYTDYTRWLGPPHYTELDDHSWWPLFPSAADLVIRLGGGTCSSRTVNGIALLALIPIFAALTGERRRWRLLILAAIPFGAWLYIGEADTFFLALSALLVWIVGQGEHYPRRAGIAALAVGVLVGLAKPNGLALVPALGVWGMAQTKSFFNAESAEHAEENQVKAIDADGPTSQKTLFSPFYPPRSLRSLRLNVLKLFADRNPAWVAALGAIGIVLGTVWWVYRTSGTYPYFVLMVQRSLWWHEFDPWSLSSFATTYQSHLTLVRGAGTLTMLSVQRVIELGGVIVALALSLSQLPPRWPGGERIPIPLAWRVGVWSMVGLMLASGQAHAIDRYTASNVFAVLIWYRLVFGAPGQRVTWRITSFAGLVRWTWLISGPVLWALSFCLLGWNPVV